MTEPDRYDEFGLFQENAEEFGIPWNGPPEVARLPLPLAGGRSLSALRWGSEPPELVLLHGGSQNAHTWDTVALSLDRPLVAVDLPGHGHSDGSADGGLSPEGYADDVAVAVDAVAPEARAVVGMSLGGLTAIALAARHPRLVRRLVLVDITPGVDNRKSAAILAFVNGPPSFASFDELLARTVEHNPSRSVASLRRGILHNAEQQADGSWVWRWARHRRPADAVSDGGRIDAGRLWDELSALDIPVLLVRGMAAGSVVDDDDETEFLRRAAHGEVVRVEGAGHSVQGDRPVELARLIAAFADR